MAKDNEFRKVGAIKIQPKKERKNLQSLEWYKAVFESAEIKEGQRGEYVRFTFKITSGECDDGSPATGQLVSALASYDTSIGSKFYGFLAGILGREPEQDEECDLKPYYGESYEVNVEVEKKKGATEAYTNIKKIRPPKKSTKTKPVEVSTKPKTKIKTKEPEVTVKKKKK